MARAPERSRTEKVFTHEMPQHLDLYTDNKMVA